VTISELKSNTCCYKCEQLHLIFNWIRRNFIVSPCYPVASKQGPLSHETDFSCSSVNIDQCNPIIPLNTHVTYGYMASNCSLAPLNFSTRQKDSTCAARANPNTCLSKRGDDGEGKCSMRKKLMGSYRSGVQRVATQNKELQKWLSRRAARSLRNGERQGEERITLQGNHTTEGAPRRAEQRTSSFQSRDFIHRGSHKVSVSATNMTGRTFGNRTVKPNQGDEMFTAQESECDWPQNQPEQSNSGTESDERTQLSPVELKVESNSLVGIVGRVAPLISVQPRNKLSVKGLAQIIRAK
jgi:hypothetical protein